MESLLCDSAPIIPDSPEKGNPHPVKTRRRSGSRRKFLVDKPSRLGYSQWQRRTLYLPGGGTVMTKALVSVTGADRTGIIAGVAGSLSEMNINILDITQTILGGYFTMLMIVDLSGATCDFAGALEELTAVGQRMGMVIHMQRVDIFDAMHRI
jgi:ACT domain-containing protein